MGDRHRPHRHSPERRSPTRTATYTLAGLAPGTYRATIVDPNGGSTQQSYDGGVDYAGGTPINVNPGNTTAIEASLHHP